MAASFRQTRAPNLRWNPEDVQLIVQWICYRDEDGNPTHLSSYLKGNKMETCRALLTESGLQTQRPDIARDKVRDKLNDMIKTFKKTRALADSTGWGVDVSKHDAIAENTNGVTIKDIILRKCPYYYDFEEIMGDLPTITPPFIMESVTPDTGQHSLYDPSGETQAAET